LFQIFKRLQAKQTAGMDDPGIFSSTGSLWIVVVACLTFLLAGFIKGVVGLGLPTVAVGLLSLVMTPVQAAALMIVPSFATNVWQLAMGPGFRPLLRRLRSMLAGVWLGTWAAGAVLHGKDTTLHATTALGIALVLYAIAGLSHVRLRTSPRKEIWLSPIIGGITGAVTVATGVFVIPAVPYLQSLGLEKDELVQALGISFTVSTLALAAVLIRAGALEASAAGISILALLPALAGMSLGQYVRRKIRAAAFRFYFFLGLLLLGAHLALRPWI
jgi:uncharacterized membrane protein YfcA